MVSTFITRVIFLYCIELKKFNTIFNSLVYLIILTLILKYLTPFIFEELPLYFLTIFLIFITTIFLELNGYFKGVYDEDNNDNIYYMRIVFYVFNVGMLSFLLIWQMSVYQEAQPKCTKNLECEKSYISFKDSIRDIWIHNCNEIDKSSYMDINIDLLFKEGINALYTKKEVFTNLNIAEKCYMDLEELMNLISNKCKKEYIKFNELFCNV